MKNFILGGLHFTLWLMMVGAAMNLTFGEYGRQLSSRTIT